VSHAIPVTTRCRCGAQLEPCNFFPVDFLEGAAAQGKEWGVEAVAFFGCRACGEWVVLPAERMPGRRSTAEGDDAN
jgi:hypothetical protein